MTLQAFYSSKKNKVKKLETNHLDKILIISLFLTFLTYIFLKFTFIKYHCTVYLFKYMKVFKFIKINFL